VYEPRGVIYESDVKGTIQDITTVVILGPIKWWSLYCHLHTDMERSCHVQSATVNFHFTETK